MVSTRDFEALCGGSIPPPETIGSTRRLPVLDMAMEVAGIILVWAMVAIFGWIFLAATPCQSSAVNDLPGVTN